MNKFIDSAIPREFALARVRRSFGVHPAVAIVGPRQCGKTTLARLFAQHEARIVFFDLERFADRRLLKNAESVLLD